MKVRSGSSNHCMGSIRHNHLSYERQSRSLRANDTSAIESNARAIDIGSKQKLFKTFPILMNYDLHMAIRKVTSKSYSRSTANLVIYKHMKRNDFYCYNCRFAFCRFTNMTINSFDYFVYRVHFFFAINKQIDIRRRVFFEIISFKRFIGRNR